MKRAQIHLPANMGEKVADAVCAGMGSWRFIIIQSIVVALWITANLVAIAFRFDPYPFILLNLLFSTQAAYASPLILMSQNRQADKDRKMAMLADEEIDEDHKLLLDLNEQQLEILKLLRGSDEEWKDDRGNGGRKNTDVVVRQQAEEFVRTGISPWKSKKDHRKFIRARFPDLAAQLQADPSDEEVTPHE